MFPDLGCRANYISVATTTWTSLDTSEEDALVTQINATRTQALRDLAPDMGAYINEV